MAKSKAATIYAGIGHLFAWVWMIGFIATIYFFVTAIFFDGLWSSFFWGLGVSIVGKWLAYGFMDNKDRVLRENKLMSEGLSKKEAGQKWIEEYTNSAPGYDLIIKEYSEFLEKNPVADDVRDTKKLPHLKSDILNAIYWNISRIEDENIREALKICALSLAHYQQGVGDQDLTQLGIDLTKIDAANFDNDELIDLASAITGNPDRERWEEFWKLVESDTIEISKKLQQAEQ